MFHHEPSTEDFTAAQSSSLQAIAPEQSPDPSMMNFTASEQVLTTSHLALLTHAMDRLTERTNRLEGRQEKIVYIMEKMQEQQEKLIQAQQMLAQTQYRVTESAEVSTGLQAQLADNLASTNAAVERLDRLMDFVFRQAQADDELIIDPDLSDWLEEAE
jgi:septal ring factor EnvC (AmiA/AmiB activator)